ncbi:MAG: YlbF family regulator [Lachnospiraceae bacterium]|nr:YlbF family regulator [Lachnospiraceae bacterium]
MKDIIDRLRECGEYKHYLEEKEKILRFPELKSSIYRLREINGLIQEVTDQDREEELRAEYDRLYSDIRIHDFMQAELDYCRMFQEIQAIMAQELDLE